MTIKIVLLDLRILPSKLELHLIEWRAGSRAIDVIADALGNQLAKQIMEDFRKDSKQLIISWNNSTTNQSSEIGGVGSLDWELEDNMILTINYENEATSKEQIDESIDWYMKNVNQ